MTPRGTAFINRELSWLAFNERVLEEAADRATPLFEALKFAAITASNLDEFFMVRVAGLKQAVEDQDPTVDLAGLTAAQQLEEVSRRAHVLFDALYSLTTRQLLPALAERGIRILRWADLDEPKQASLTSFFRDMVLPVLTPLAVDPTRPFPVLSSLTLNLAVLVEPATGETERRLAIVPSPSGLRRLVQVADPLCVTFVPLEEIIRAHLPLLFVGQAIVESGVIRLARDAELEIDDEGGRTQLEQVERQLRRRRGSDVVRLETEAGASDDLIDMLRLRLDLSSDDVYKASGLVDLRALVVVTELPGYEGLRDAPVTAADVLAEERADIFTVLDERDLLLHHPYDGYEPVTTLLAEAADDPEVLAIKHTLYRASVGSSIIASLRRAAERGKQVTVVIELTARFDEERNIQWARTLEEAGAHVIYGVRGYKVHAKMCLIVRRTAHGLRRYVHLGTGNYNERTARTYTDFGLMTASSAFTEDATAFFNALTGYSDPPKMNKLVMAPTALRQRIVKLVEREARRARAGQPAEIVAKMNSLIDEEIIDALYSASKAGVRIRLAVRGICALRPGLPDVSEHIEVVSVVDRFLEHSRAVHVLNGGDDEVYLSSADWMTRNLDRRIELLFPVESAEHKARVIYALRAMFRDTTKARWLGPDGSYKRRRRPAGEPALRVQEHLQDEARRTAAIARDRLGGSLQPQEKLTSS